MRRLAIAALLCLAAGAAHGHGPAAWIMADPETAWCCGPEDCEPVAGRARYAGDAWTVDGLEGFLAEGARGLFKDRRTPDGGPWACRNLRTNAIRCLILPRGKM